LFLVKRSQGEITDICLALKKRGFGVNRWNGVGGKTEENESVEETAIRETEEEIGVNATDIRKVAEISFYFPHNPAWDQLVHIYFSENWQGEPKETEEARPAWFSPKELPFENMWPDDAYWMPEVLAGKLLKGSFTFKENDIIEKRELNIVEEI